MLRILAVVTVSIMLFVTTPVQAWFDGGHMVVAYIAYQKLAPVTRARVDGLLKLNPMYSAWTKGVTQKRKGLVAFLRAATWPDCIKQATCAPGYTSDGGDIPPGNPTDNQNIGYVDKLMHKYWHFVDLPDSAGSPGEPPKVPQQLEVVLAGLPESEARVDDDLVARDARIHRGCSPRGEERRDVLDDVIVRRVEKPGVASERCRERESPSRSPSWPPWPWRSRALPPSGPTPPPTRSSGRSTRRVRSSAG